METIIYTINMLRLLKLSSYENINAFTFLFDDYLDGSSWISWKNDSW